MKIFYNYKEALEDFKDKGIIIFPTESVYGLGAPALLSSEVEKIYKIKNRPRINPLIVHFLNLKQVEEYVYMNDLAKNLCKIFWPGPLTILLKKKNNLLNASNNGSDMICCRVSNSSFLKKLIEEKGPICAPSANLSSLITITNKEMAISQYENTNIGIFVDDSIIGGIESTIITCENNNIKILREGLISKEELSIYGNTEIIHKGQKVPGSYFKHYQISKTLKIGTKNEENFFITIGDNIGDFNLSKQKKQKEIFKNFFYSFYLGDISNKKYVVLDKNIIEDLPSSLKNRLNKMLNLI
ncbi:threonylcarbamoyl-AMP synthase [Rickettsiales bacterium (ex Bugula neritina AB1)]|nr:threonylcarbamoyl-AMP synthase [Rickettsiales bacterium (ex Bugula neritina AB1)]